MSVDISQEDHIILGSLTVEERAAVLARTRRKVAQEVYTELRNKMARVGLKLNGSCVIHEDGRIRTPDATLTPPEAPPRRKGRKGRKGLKLEEMTINQMLVHLRRIACRWSYASIAANFILPGEKFPISSVCVRTWIQGSSTPWEGNAELLRKFLITYRDNREKLILRPAGRRRS